MAKDALLWLTGSRRGQEACICQCPAASAECGALERLLSQQLSPRECAAPSFAWHLHISLGAFFLVIGLVLGLFLGRLRRRAPRIDAAPGVYPDAASLEDESPSPAAAAKGGKGLRGRGVVISN